MRLRPGKLPLAAAIALALLLKALLLSLLWKAFFSAPQTKKTPAHRRRRTAPAEHAPHPLSAQG